MSRAARSTSCCRFASLTRCSWSGRAFRRRLGPMSTRRRSRARSRSIAVGPVASQIAIKMLGTNGGGFFNANAAHPFENPTALSQLHPDDLDLRARRGVDQRLRPHGRQPEAGLGHSGRDGRAVPRGRQPSATGQKPRGTTGLNALGLTGGNMEGKEVRFGIVASALFAVITTDASCGAVNAMHDSLHGPRRHDPADQHPARRNHRRRRRLRHLRHAAVRGDRNLRRRADGRTHAGICRQEDRGEGSEDGDARHPDPAADDPRLDGRRGGTAVGGRVHRQLQARTASRRSSISSRPARATTARRLAASPATRSSTTQPAPSRCSSAAS